MSTTNRPEMFLVRLKGAITTEAPLACALPYEKKSKSDPQPFPLCERRPFYPASGFLGRVRRALVGDIREALTQDGVLPWEIETYFVMAIGGACGFPKERKLVAGEDRRLRDDNPLESLFGSVRMAGRLGVGHAYAAKPLGEKEELPVMPVARSLDFARDGSEMEYIAPGEIDRLLVRLANDRTNSANKTELQKLVRAKKAEAKRADNNDDKNRLMDEARALQNEATANRTGGKSAVSIQQALPGYRYLPKDISLEQSIMASPVTLAEIGYLLAALRAFSANPVLGGHRHHGCGLVRAEWTVHAKPVRAVSGLRRWGDIKVSLDEGMVMTGERLEEALALYDADRAQNFANRNFTRREHIPDITFVERNEEEDEEEKGTAD